MATLQKSLSMIRQLQDEELDMVGGLQATTRTTETWSWSTHGGNTVLDDVITTESPD